MKSHGLFIKKLGSILYEKDLSMMRLMLGGAELLWALNCWYPGTSFSHPGHEFMSSIASENVWGSLFFVSSVIQIYIVLYSKEYTIYSRIFSFWNFVLWATSVMTIFLAIHPPPVAMSGELILVAASFWSFLRPILLCHLLARSFKDSETAEQNSFMDTQLS